MKPTIYIHHDAYRTPGPHLQLVDAQHREEGYPQSFFGYHTFYQYFVEQDGTTIATRQHMDPAVVYKPAHENSISICLAGNFSNEDPPEVQLIALDQLLDDLARQYDIDALCIKEHRDYQDTQCPGDRIPRGFFARRYIRLRMQGIRGAVEQLRLLVVQLTGK